MTLASPAELESALLSVLLSADTLRAGASGLLDALAPSLEDIESVAIAVCDRDGRTLQVVADTGTPRDWPATLDIAGANTASYIDRGASVRVAPLVSEGRAVGALLLSDPARSEQLIDQPYFNSAITTLAAVLSSLRARVDTQLRARALAARSLDGIIDGMAHQIANPLTGASALAQLLLEDMHNDGQRETVGQLRHELSRAFAVLHDLLEFHRDTGASDGILDLNAVVERVVRFRSYSIREQGIALELTASGAFIPVKLDMRSFEHALLLAVRKAEVSSHGLANRSIVIRVAERESDAVIEVSDSGPGDAPSTAAAWPDADLSYVPIPSREGNATTIDLGLIDGILRAVGGRLEVRASKLAGTTLTLVVPRAVTPNSGKSVCRILV